MNVRVKAETAKTITLEWDVPAWQEGYIATIDGSMILTDGRRHIGGSQTRGWVSIGKRLDGKPHAYGVILVADRDSGHVMSPAALVDEPNPTPVEPAAW